MTDLPKRHVVHPETGYGMGWKPSPPDARDFYYSAPITARKQLPKNVQLSDMWNKMDVYDQGQLGSCTANATAALMEYRQVEQGIKSFVPSRLFLYYFTRLMEGSEGWDAGGVIRDSVKVANKMGAPPETYWVYDIRVFTEKPVDSAIREGANHQALAYRRVTQNATQIKTAVAQGYPVTFGFTVYTNFFDVGSDGMVDMPSGSVEGGHAVVLCGYDDASQRFTVRNSWGRSFGDEGYVYFPYQYLLDQELASDWWLISKMEGQ